MQKRPKIQKYERLVIAHFLGRHSSLRQIAKILDRSVSTVSEEIRRNKVKGVYNPEKAQHKSYVRRKYSKYQGMKVIGNSNLRRYVEGKLKKGWSPEQISGRLRRTNLPRVSTKTLYNYVHSVYGRSLEPHLRHWRTKGGRHYPSSGIKDRMFVEDREEVANQRGRYGDYEADFIVSGRGGQGAILVLIDRLSRYCFLRKVESRKTEDINLLIYKTLSKVGVRSLTLDNDVSFQKHEDLRLLLGAPIYFTHPYHSWEKGSVENLNKLIRQYVEKGGDISKCSGKYLKKVEKLLRERPRKCLDYLSPKEVMERGGCLKGWHNVNFRVNKKNTRGVRIEG